MRFLGSKYIDRLSSPLRSHSQKLNFPNDQETIKMDGPYFAPIKMDGPYFIIKMDGPYFMAVLYGFSIQTVLRLPTPMMT